MAVKHRSTSSRLYGENPAKQNTSRKMLEIHTNRECYKATLFKSCNEHNDRAADRETAEVRQTYGQLTSQTDTWQLLEQRKTVCKNMFRNN